jgi:hypothetical protein
MPRRTLLPKRDRDELRAIRLEVAAIRALFAELQEVLEAEAEANAR